MSPSFGLLTRKSNEDKFQLCYENPCIECLNEYSIDFLCFQCQLSYIFQNKKQENNLDSISFKGVFINDSPLRENVITGKLKECTEYEVRLQNIYKAGFETITDELLSHEKTVCESGFSQMTLISLILLVSSLALVTAILIIILMVKRNKISDSKYLALPHL